MKTIYKYHLISPMSNIKLPKGAKILSVINQLEKIIIYALVDPEELELEEFTFAILPTGTYPATYNDNYIFLGTVSFNGGSLVFHVFYTKDGA
jgi:hypothetical protein